MADDRKIAISSSNHVGPDEVARHTFATSRRGFDPAEVRAFLEEVARELSATLERRAIGEGHHGGGAPGRAPGTR